MTEVEAELDHAHWVENEEIIDAGPILYGTFFLEDGTCHIYAYKVRCRICQDEYLVPVG